MKKFNSLIALLLVGNLLFADVIELASPGLSATSPYYDSVVSTASALANPALTADIQRYTFDLNYMLLADTDDSKFGHSIDIGGAMSSKYGVLSASGNLLLTEALSDTDLYAGTTGMLNLNFAKEIYSDLYFGTGVTTLLGSTSSGFDWGLGLNLGIVKLMGDLTPFFKDFKWGAAVKNIGKGYQDDAGYFDGVADVITPIGFAEFTPFSNDVLDLSLATELSFPSLTNFNLELGARALIYDDFIVDTSLDMDIEELIDGSVTSLIPSLFFGYNFIAADEDIQVNLAGNSYANGVWAFGAGATMPLGERDKNPPVVDIDYEETQYISPNFDGIQDELDFPIEVTDERYIAGYEVVITDSFGKEVKKIVNKDERPENESLENLWTRLISPKSGTPVPESFRWDGKQDNGELVPDGEYIFHTWFSDDNGNSTTSEKHTFVVDNTDPVVELTPPAGLDLIFSPNGDGNKDELVIPQTGSDEVRWYAEVSDFMGNVVKSQGWDNTTLDKFIWDGKDDTGQLVPDGVYQYKVSSTDLAGNSVEDSVDNIIINTKQPPIGITIDTNSFSPNADSVKDYMEFVLDIPVKTGIIRWELEIKDKYGNAVNNFSTDKEGYSVIEDNIRFDGKDSAGKVLIEGSYTGELSVVYQNGHSPVVESPQFTIDITPPAANVTPAYTMFSPNGDKSKDSILFNQSSTKEEDWNGAIYDEFGTLIYETEWKGEIDKVFSWNGKNNDGEIQDDGLFTYVLSSTDRSGNSYKGDSIEFELNTTKSEITLALSKDAFSPGDKGDSVKVIPDIESSTSVVKQSVDILDKNSRVVKTISRSVSDKDILWDGTDSNGNTAADGIYTGKINAEFENGNKVVALTSPLLLDTVKPSVSVKRKERYNVFSPNGDGKSDYLTFIQETSEEEEWIGEVRDSRGQVVYTSRWSGKAPAEFEFSGKNMDNENLEDGSYTYKLYAVDRAGNRAESKTETLRIDTEDIDLFISTNLTHFSPNGDGVKDSLEFRPDIKKNDGIINTLYEVINSSGDVVYSSDKNVGWNGKTSSGAVASDGEYIVRMTVNYERGDAPVASTAFILDTKAPNAEVVVENSIFSPNGDGNRDVVKISNKSSDKAEWVLQIKDDQDNSVKESRLNGELTADWDFDGRGEDLSILENGSYYYILTGKDEAGNSYSSGKQNITLDSTPSSVFVTNDYEVFSPNGDRVKDRVTFSIKVDSESPVESWSFNIVDSKARVVKEITGGNIPKAVEWDGQSVDGISPDGRYRGVLKVVHVNGNNPQSTTPFFNLDSTYPEITLSVVNELFSPDGDGLKDNVILSQRGNGEELYKGVVYNSSNTLVNEWFWKDSITPFNWDGRDSSGNIVPDGKYRYVVETTDAGGNRTAKSINNIEIDTSETDIFITYKKAVFAPDLVRTLGPQTFGLIVNNRKGIDTWSVKILDKDNKVLQTLKGRDQVPEFVEWNGKDSKGNEVNGVVKAEFNTIYKKGNSPKYLTKTFIADSEHPQIKVVTSPTPFSPDDDFVDDELTINLGVKDLSNIKEWKFKIFDPKGNDFITFEGEGRPGQKIIWDGKSSKGELVQAAEEYNYQMSVTDEAGHTGVVRGEIPVDILVIKEGDKLKIKISSIIFEPNSSVLASNGVNASSNDKILKRLSEILNKYSSYQIVIEGHANNIYGNQITRAQSESLNDFSEDRAKAVMSSLSKLGIAKGRMSTVGMGGQTPVVDYSDYDNAWKNRRVEFILVK